MSEKAVTLLGLGDFRGDLGGEVWTLNDYYRRMPYLKPARVFQIHEDTTNLDHPPTNSPRFRDWRLRYAESGAEIVTIKDFGFPRQKILDMPALAAKYGADSLCSTLCYMMAVCAEERPGAVRICGFQLKNDHAWQVPVTLRWLWRLRDFGIAVNADDEDEWNADNLRSAFEMGMGQGAYGAIVGGDIYRAMMEAIKAVGANA